MRRSVHTASVAVGAVNETATPGVFYIVVRREQYERLGQHLRTADRPWIELTFAEVASIVGEHLPRSAFQHSAWWGSDPKHTQSVWLNAGYTASPNLTAEKVMFTRTG